MFKQSVLNQSGEMASLFSEWESSGKSRSSIIVGERVTGTVVAITGQRACVDIGLKSESEVALAELVCAGVKVGQQASFLVLGNPNEDGEVPLSLGWAVVLDALDNHSIVSATITGLAGAKGNYMPGVHALVAGVSGFIPASKLELPRRELQNMIDNSTPIDVVVLKAELGRHNLVLSQKDAAQEKRRLFLESLQPGQKVNGTVTNITTFGVFAHIGSGVSGLVHRSEVTSNRTATQEELSELMPVGTTAEFEVKTVNLEKSQVSLKLTEAPQVRFLKALKPGMVIKSRVARIAAFGAFIPLGAGIDGLLHNSALGQAGATAQQLLSIGEAIEVTVNSVDVNAQRVSLSLKASG